MRPNSPIQRLGRKSRIIFKNELANTAKFSAPTFNALSQNRNLLTQRNRINLKNPDLNFKEISNSFIEISQDKSRNYDDKKDLINNFWGSDKFTSNLLKFKKSINKQASLNSWRSLKNNRLIFTQPKRNPFELNKPVKFSILPEVRSITDTVYQKKVSYI